ncbi:MAG: GAF domain-containing protein [Anaerolineales bacterium]|nr:GAF domain-containing protein [Anaerolineales bacterium]
MSLTNVLSKWRNLWEHLTQPIASIEEDEQRQQASLLAALSIALLGAGTILLIIWVTTNPDFQAAPLISLGIVVAITAVYLLSRTLYYRIGATILIAMMMLMVTTIILTAPGSMTERMLALNFLVVAILLASMLFNIRVTAIVAALSILFTTLFFFLPEVSFATTYSFLVFIIITSALLIAAIAIRNYYITAHRKAEIALQKNEARFQKMFTNHAAVMLLIEPASGTIIDANHAAKKFYGYSISQLCTMNITELNMLPPEQVLSERQRAIQEKRNYFIFPHRLASGEIRTVEVHSSPIGLENREVLFSIIHDITERERASKALLARTNELTALEETLLDITSPQPLSVLLNIIVERAATLLQATSGGLYLTEPEQHQVRCVVSYNTVGDFTGTVLNYGEGAAGHVAQSGEPLIIDDYRTWLNRAEIFEDERPFQTILSAPLIWQGHVTGVIHMLKSHSEEQFSQKDLDLLVMFANHAAMAVENARLRSELEQELHERKQAEAERERLIAELQSALAQVNRLSGLLPICASCKKIRDDEGYWQDVSIYIRNHSEAEFTHGICPDCMRDLYPEIYDADE